MGRKGRGTETKREERKKKKILRRFREKKKMKNKFRKRSLRLFICKIYKVHALPCQRKNLLNKKLCFYLKGENKKKIIYERKTKWRRAESSIARHTSSAYLLVSGFLTKSPTFIQRPFTPLSTCTQTRLNSL